MADDPAKALNGQARTTVLDMLACLGRSHLVDRLRDRPLPELLETVFAELSEADDEARDAPRLRARVEELSAELAQAQDAPRHLAKLNERLGEAQARVLELELSLSTTIHRMLQHEAYEDRQLAATFGVMEGLKVLAIILSGRGRLKELVDAMAKPLEDVQRLSKPDDKEGGPT